MIYDLAIVGYGPTGATLANLLGTTGASVLLIRPLLRANKARGRIAHIVIFFIFIVGNCGGLLTRSGVSPDARAHLASIVEAIRKTRASVFLVSNEVGSGVVPAFKSGRLYRDLLGELNQQIARVATQVVLLVAGIPVPIKGRL